MKENLLDMYLIEKISFFYHFFELSIKIKIKIADSKKSNLCKTFQTTTTIIFIFIFNSIQWKGIWSIVWSGWPFTQIEILFNLLTAKPVLPISELLFHPNILLTKVSFNWPKHFIIAQKTSNPWPKNRFQYQKAAWLSKSI